MPRAMRAVERGRRSEPRQSSAWSIGIGPRARRAASVSPCRLSMTRKSRPFSCPTSCRVQMCGWLSEAIARASRSKRSRGSCAPPPGGRSTLMATARSSRVSRARVDVAHAAGAEQRLDLVDAQARARRQRWCILRVREISGEGIEDFFSRTLAKASGLLMGREKRRDSGQQRLIVTAQSARLREPLLRRPLECLLEYVLHAGPRRRERHGGPDSCGT